MSSIGKIGRLPLAVREELNRKLQDAVPAIALVPWLNSLKSVQEIMATWFEGRPITDGNVSEWKNGGYHFWRLQQEAILHIQRASEESRQLQTHSQGRAGDDLALILQARYAALISQWDGDINDKEKIKLLRELCADVVRLRRGDHQQRRLAIAEQATA